MPASSRTALLVQFVHVKLKIADLDPAEASRGEKLRPLAGRLPVQEEIRLFIWNIRSNKLSTCAQANRSETESADW